MDATTPIQRVPVDEIAARARKARFGYVVATAFASVFFGLGWLAGRCWYGLVFLAVAVSIGFRQGARRPDQAETQVNAPAP